MRIVGFTGTSEGMSSSQKIGLRLLLYHCDEFHHGDCIGADAEAHDIARSMGIFIVIHPPDYPSKRAFKEGDMLLPEKPYLERNRGIAIACTRLIATPKGYAEELRSGTWATIRYARQMHKHITIILRNGRRRIEGPALLF